MTCLVPSFSAEWDVPPVSFSLAEFNNLEMPSMVYRANIPSPVSTDRSDFGKELEMLEKYLESLNVQNNQLKREAEAEAKTSSTITSTTAPAELQRLLLETLPPPAFEGESRDQSQSLDDVTPVQEVKPEEIAEPQQPKIEEMELPLPEECSSGHDVMPSETCIPSQLQREGSEGDLQRPSLRIVEYIASATSEEDCSVQEHRSTEYHVVQSHDLILDIPLPPPSFDYPIPDYQSTTAISATSSYSTTGPATPPSTTTQKVDASPKTSPTDNLAILKRHCTRLASVLRGLYTYTLGGMSCISPYETQIHAGKLLRAIESVEIASNAPVPSPILWAKISDQSRNLRWEAEALLETMMSMPYSDLKAMPNIITNLQNAISYIQKIRLNMSSTIEMYENDPNAKELILPSENVVKTEVEKTMVAAASTPQPSRVLNEEQNRRYTISPRRLNRAVSRKMNMSEFYEQAKSGVVPNMEKSGGPVTKATVAQSLGEFNTKNDRPKKKKGVGKIFHTLGRKKDDLDQERASTSVFLTMRGKVVENNQPKSTSIEYPKSFRTFSRIQGNQNEIAPRTMDPQSDTAEEVKRVMEEVRMIKSSKSAIVSGPPALMAGVNHDSKEESPETCSSRMGTMPSTTINVTYSSSSECTDDCGGCGSQVGKDKEIWSTTSKGQNWHMKCTKCSSCSVPFGENTKYEGLDGNLYCLDHFFRTFHFCQKCNNMVSGDPQEDAPWNKKKAFVRPFAETSAEVGVVHLFGRRWHAHCLACKVCDIPLDSHDVSSQIDRTHSVRMTKKSGLQPIKQRAHIKGNNLYCVEHHP